MNISYDVNTTITDDFIKQEVYNEIDGMVNTLSREIIDIKNQQFHDALVKLGWTPPSKITEK